MSDETGCCALLHALRLSCMFVQVPVATDKVFMLACVLRLLCVCVAVCSYSLLAILQHLLVYECMHFIQKGCSLGVLPCCNLGLLGSRIRVPIMELRAM